tara:strand:- start:25 stop:243 length:219 start_codon:yes stop_codon:yes gene_type:complete
MVSPEQKALNKIKNDKYKWKKQIKFECECGSLYSKDKLTQHKKTKKHINYINDKEHKRMMVDLIDETINPDL